MAGSASGGGAGFEEALQALAQSRKDIESFFSASGFAYVGAVDTSPFARKHNARLGRYCYVNPKGGDAGEIPVFKTMLDVPDWVSVAVVKTSPRVVPQVIEDCAKRGVKNILLFSSGFAEIGAEGIELERQAAEAGRRAGVRMIGPNTNDNSFEVFAPPANHRGGLIGLITQSGFNGRPIVEGVHMGVGFRRWITAGNEVDLDVADFMNYFAHDEKATVIAGYVEGFKSIDKTRAALQALNDKDKPVILLKIGATEGGARMAASHTGHLAGSDAVINGLFRQHGVTRVRDLDELQETANLFAKMPAGTGPRCALYSVSGGSTTLMAETAETFGVPAPELTAETQRRLHTYLRSDLTVRNPIDNGGTFVIAAPQDKRIEVLNLIADDPNVDVIVVGITGAFGALSDGMAEDILAWAPTAKKPVVATWNSVVVEGKGYPALVQSGVPIFRSFRKCFQALRAFNDYQARRGTFRHRAWTVTPLTAAQEAALARPGVVETGSARALLEKAGIPLVREDLVSGAAAAAASAAKMGGLVAMKLASPDFPHKSDVGLVKLGIDPADAGRVHDELVARAKALKADARIDGVVVQEMIRGGVEMIVGLSTDPVLGPSLTIGAGGVYAELLRDVAIRPLPVDEADVRDMIGELRLGALLDGFRGSPKVDKDGLVKVALQVAALGLAAKGRLAELDLNPVIVLPERAVAVDFLAVAGEA
jgi:acyl-CoA synthetase (NDP forming)